MDCKSITVSLEGASGDYYVADHSGVKQAKLSELSSLITWLSVVLSVLGLGVALQLYDATNELEGNHVLFALVVFVVLQMLVSQMVSWWNAESIKCLSYAKNLLDHTPDMEVSKRLLGRISLNFWELSRDMKAAAVSLKSLMLVYLCAAFFVLFTVDDLSSVLQVRGGTSWCSLLVLHALLSLYWLVKAHISNEYILILQKRERLYFFKCLYGEVVLIVSDGARSIVMPYGRQVQRDDSASGCMVLGDDNSDLKVDYDALKSHMYQFGRTGGATLVKGKTEISRAVEMDGSRRRDENHTG